MLRDPDLDAIRDHPEFSGVVARIKANNARVLEKFKLTSDTRFPPTDARRAPHRVP